MIMRNKWWHDEYSTTYYSHDQYNVDDINEFKKLLAEPDFDIEKYITLDAYGLYFNYRLSSKNRISWSEDYAELRKYLTLVGIVEL